MNFTPLHKYKNGVNCIRLDFIKEILTNPLLSESENWKELIQKNLLEIKTAHSSISIHNLKFPLVVSPKCILEADKISKSLFLRALFDDEGSVHLLGKSISIEMIVKDIIAGVSEILKEFGIRPSKIKERTYKKGEKSYKLYITNQTDIKRFHQFISFNHSEKKKKLKNLIKSYKLQRYKHYEIETLIIELLKNKNGITAKELTERLNRKSVPRFRTYHLWRLEKQGIIKSRKENKGLKVYYLPEINGGEGSTEAKG